MVSGGGCESNQGSDCRLPLLVALIDYLEEEEVALIDYCLIIDYLP